MAQITMNPAPFLTMWATVVAGHLGFGKEEAISLAKAFAGLPTRSRGPRPGLSQSRPKTERKEDPGRAGGRDELKQTSFQNFNHPKASERFLASTTACDPLGRGGPAALSPGPALEV